MILNNEKTKCETNMTGGTAFTICANAKMFKILSNSMYSNKEKAIIREVSCNAFDANVDAGNADIPIVVHLPNILEPFFSIKDSGPGLTPEQMVNVYTQYGNSTKTDRNDQIGALGLGSKSPFSYIDSFTVISITEGTKNTYSCYIDGNGEPQLQPFGSVETDERNGVEVTFPVKQDDFSKFRKEAEITFRPFIVHPEITGNKDYTRKEFNVLASSNGDTESATADWQLVEPVAIDRWHRESIKVAVQGNIEYPINTNIFYDKLSKQAKAITSENYRLHFNIGELDIAASREELGYDENTITNIVNKIEQMGREIEQVQNENIQKCETKYEAMKYVKKLRQQSSLYHDFEFKYNDEEIDGEILLPQDTEIVKYSVNNRGNIGRHEFRSSYGNRVMGISLRNSVFILNDNNKKGQAVSKARSLTNYDTDVYLIQDIKTIEILGNPEFINASEVHLDKQKKAKSSGSFFKKFYNSAYTHNQWSSLYASADEIDLDLDKKFFYCALRSRRSSENVDIFTIKSVAEHFGLIPKDTEVYGVQANHSSTKKFQEYQGIEFIDYVVQKISKSKKVKTALKMFDDYSIFSQLQSMDSSFRNLIEMNSFIEKLRENNPNNIFVDIYEDYKRTKDSDNPLLRQLRDISRQCNLTINETPYNKIAELYARYPLITHLGWRPNSELCIDYILGQDLLRESKEKKQLAETESANDTENIKTEEVA
jgi:hypothetical protein